MTKRIEISLHPREAEMLIEHFTKGGYPEIALKVSNQIVEQLSYSEATPLDWANDVRNLAFLRSIGGV